MYNFSRNTKACLECLIIYVKMDTGTYVLLDIALERI